MATRKKKTPTGKKSPRSHGALLFWVVFTIVIVVLFLVNAPRIALTVQETHILEKLAGRATTETTGQSADAPSADAPSPAAPQNETTLPQVKIIDEEKTPPTAPPTTTTTPTGETAVTKSPPPLPTGETRQRTLYFVNIDAAGSINLVKTTRAVPLSDSPLIDVLSALFAGPDAAEERRGLSSLIPEGTAVIAATVRDGVATVNMSENFMFNRYGAEAYYAALKQLVWTATEFGSVGKVQILIEGRRVQFLAENIPIGAPLGRDDL